MGARLGRRSIRGDVTSILRLCYPARTNTARRLRAPVSPVNRKWTALQPRVGVYLELDDRQGALLDRHGHREMPDLLRDWECDDLVYFKYTAYFSACRGNAVIAA
jgi:hypothetical protein